jgi:S1-C subfamily serine protease
MSGALFVLAAAVFAGAVLYGKQSRSQEKSPPITLLDINRAYLKVTRQVRAAVVEVSVKEVRIIFGKSRTSELSLSGTVWDAEGHIVTLVRGLKRGSQILVKPLDTLDGAGKPISATWLGSDDKTGLAVLKATLNGRATVLKQRSANRALVPGSLIVTVGNPFGFRSSVRMGNIAGLNRTTTMGEVSFQNAMEITSPVNPGDPGGLVVDARGELIGIMASSLRNPAFSRSRELGDPFEAMGRQAAYSGAQGIGFAIPIKTVIEAVARIKAQKKAKKAWLGVDVRPLAAFSSRDRKQLGLEDYEGGVLIVAITVGSPADKAGLRSGDLILNWDAKKITELQELAASVRNTRMGTTVKVSIVRRGTTKELSVEFSLGQ